MVQQSTCHITGCTDPACSRMDGKALCCEHFLAYCYDNLDNYQRQIREQTYRDATVEAMRRFLLHCTREAIDLAHGPDPLENLQRARLLDILMRASDMTRHLRRSPRKEMAIPLTIRCEKLGHQWEEEAQTRVVSRFGALLHAQHQVETGDLLFVARRDEDRQTRARVAWAQQDDQGGTELGIELLNCDNFWGLDWSYADPMLHEPEMILKLADDAGNLLRDRKSRQRQPAPQPPAGSPSN